MKSRFNSRPKDASLVLTFNSEHNAWLPDIDIIFQYFYMFSFVRKSCDTKGLFWALQITIMPFLVMIQVNALTLGSIKKQSDGL